MPCLPIKRSVFARVRVEYLGHWISTEGVEADQENIRAMLQWPIPKSIKELRGFLGLTRYYQHFVKDYGSMAAPLTQLLKDFFVWTNEATVAFETLRQVMMTLLVLALPDFEMAFTIEIDALGFGVGVVLTHKGRPIAFFSQALCARA